MSSRDVVPAGRGDAGALADDLHVVLVEPEIHGNTGSSGRTCLAAGARLHLVEPLGFSLDDARVKRAGLDYWPRVRPVVWPSWDELVPRLDSLGRAHFFASDAGRDYWEASFRGPTVLVFGRESVGLSTAIKDQYADRLLRVPMADPALRSLNLANTVAIALYEVLRQRRASSPEGETRA